MLFRTIGVLGNKFSVFLRYTGCKIGLRTRGYVSMTSLYFLRTLPHDHPLWILSIKDFPPVFRKIDFSTFSVISFDFGILVMLIILCPNFELIISSIISNDNTNRLCFVYQYRQWIPYFCFRIRAYGFFAIL